MVFREASSFHEVRRYVSEQLELFSCFTYDNKKFGEMAEDYATGKVKYFISEDLEFRGYVRVINLEDDRFDEESVAAIDIIIPTVLGENRLGDLSEVLTELGYDRAFVNRDIPWIGELFFYQDDDMRELEVPELNVSKHFEEGTGTYSLIDILKEA